MAVMSQTGEFMDTRFYKTPQVLLGGAVVEGIGGIATIVLSILALVGVIPRYLVPIAVIAAGASFLFEGGAIAARYSRLARAATDGTAQRAEVGGGATVEFLGGAAGIVLGILALLGIASATLIQTATIVFGVTLILSAGATARMDTLYAIGSEHPKMQMAADESVRVAAGAQVFAGLASAILGIIALVGVEPVILPMVALLTVGFSEMLSGGAISAKMAGLTHAA